jgi:hypothetical protein
MGIDTTGNEEIDSATAEIALALRDARPGKCEQTYYDDAQRLRDAIMAGTRSMAAKAPAGLVVEKRNASGWRVYHQASGLPVSSTAYLRLKKFAVQFRDELYATGVDFTASTEAIQEARSVVRPVIVKWERRVAQGYDVQTGENYSSK